MAVLDPTKKYTDGQKLYFKAEPPTKYNPDFHTIQGGQLGTTDPISPELGVAMITNNPWSSPYAIYMTGVPTYLRPSKIDGQTIPLTNTPYDFSQVFKSGWSYLKSMIDVVNIVEARYIISDYLNGFNALPADPYYGYSTKCPPVWFGEYWDSNHPDWGIRVYAIAGLIEASGGGNFISEDLNGMTDKLTVVCCDTVCKTNSKQTFRNYFWCFFNPSTGVITKSINWKGGTMYDSPLEDGGDDMGWADLPSEDFLKTGMSRAYVFDGSQSSIHALNSLSAYLWSGNIAGMLDNIVADPMDCIIALNRMPSYENISKGSTDRLVIGNLSIPKYDDLLVDETVTSLGSEWYTVNCGSITVPAVHGNYLDYEPYTQVDIFLPYIGMIKISPKDIVGKSIYIRYNIDTLTGQCCCQIGDDSNGTHILYSYNGNCLTQFPVSGANYSNIISGAFSLVGGAMATAGAKAVEGVVGGMNGAVQGGLSMFESDVQRGGSISCTAGALGCDTPYAIVTTRMPIVDANYNTYVGQPYFKASTLSSLSGFTIVEEVQLSGVVATQGELDEIETLLKGGVIL